MRQKVLKKVKFVFIILMIINIVFLSYASLSASDGSAFVTKEIFESTLADFNARLTTFETGINTKIDSQVTSYLDRNGIWSGVEQTMSKPYKRYGITQSWHYMLSASIKDKAGNNDYLFQDDIIVQNISKTGLCNVVFETLKLGTANITNWENNTEAPNTASPNGYGTMMYNWTDSSGNFSDAAEVSSYRAKITVLFKFVEVVGSTNYEKVIFTVANSNPSVYSWSMSNSNYGQTISFVPDKQSLYFFVGQGHKLKCQLRVILASNYSGSASYKFSSITTGSYTGNWGYIANCVIY